MLAKSEIRNIILQFVEPWNTGKVDAFDALCAPTYRLGETATLHDLKSAVLEYRRAMPDLYSTVGEIIIDGEKVAYTWTMHGTHRAELHGIPATGKPVVVKGITILHFANGKIVHDEFESSSPSFEQQVAEPHKQPA